MNQEDQSNPVVNPPPGSSQFTNRMLFECRNDIEKMNEVNVYEPLTGQDESIARLCLFGIVYAELPRILSTQQIK